MGALVTLQAAHAGYSGRPVLHGIDLTVQPGERIAVLGRSGAGKSTLLDLLFQHLAPRAALIPQAASLVPVLSVFHNVYMGRLDRNPAWRNLCTLAWPAQRDVGEVTATLALVGLEDKLFARAGELSGGQQQRISVARALYNGRPIVIADEPVSALDRGQAHTVLTRLSERHETVILALHDIELALEHTGRVVVIDEGRIVLDAPSRDVTAAGLRRFYA